MPRRPATFRRLIVFVLVAALPFSKAPPLVQAGPPFAEFLDPNPAPGNQFGATVVALSTGNVVITAPFDDAGGIDAGAVYLFNGATGALISTLRGSTPGDHLGVPGVTALSNGNFVVASRDWDGAAMDVGATTWGSGTTGISGTVSAANSLVGATAGDQVGFRVVALTNGNYVTSSSTWDNGSAVDAGAATWGNGATGISGPVSVANSLVGSTSDDHVAENAGAPGVIALTNGNYVVRSPRWDNGAAVDGGAATWGNGLGGTVGAISAANSLVGTTSGDGIGSSPGLRALTNGNYVVRAPLWDNGPLQNAGAVTWGNGAVGTTGPVSASNSLVGTSAFDSVGNVTALTNGNYVVTTPTWDNGPAQDAGAATWGNGVAGTSGPLAPSNSLVGSAAFDSVGASITPLSNGNYVVRSPNWSHGATASVGAATWANGATGLSGALTAVNSLIGTTPNDLANGSVTALSNGNYVVASPGWDSGVLADVGAATWGSGTTGISGTLSPGNSFVGTKASDLVGASGVTALSNGHYVIRSPGWDHGAVPDAGAVTWRNGSVGGSGVVSAANSLVGAQPGDQVGISPVTALSNGNYVVGSPLWDNGAVTDAGAATWGNGMTGIIGVVSAANSLVGGKANDQVGSQRLGLNNGNYVAWSSAWDNGALADAGAVTWGNGTSGIVGPVSTSNSLAGALSQTSLQAVVTDNVNGTVLARFLSEGGGRVRLLSRVDGIAPTLGPVSSSNITILGADLSGSVTADNGPTISGRGFVYSEIAVNNTPTIGGTGVTQVPLAGSTGAMSATLSSLTPSTAYRFRGYATNSAGTAYTSVATFTTLTPPPPAVTTDAATDLAQSGGTLNGTINPNGFATKRRFEYGLTAGYGTTTADLGIGSGNSGVGVNFVVTGLACNTTYHFRAVGQNSGGTTNGGDLTFLTAACPGVGENNISAMTARSLGVNSTSEDELSDVRAEIWYRVRLFASRSYQFSVWPVDHEQGTDAPAMDLGIFSDDAGAVLATPAPTISSADLEGSVNSGGDSLPVSLLFQPTTTGLYKVRILRSSGGSAAHSVNVAVRETTLFSPWTSRAAGFEGFIEMHNNTNAAVSVTLRAYNNAGVLQGTGLTITLQPNATDFRTATQVGVPVNVFAGIVLTHNGAFGAVSGNITTLNGANGLSFDSPFTPRAPNVMGSPVR